MGSFAKRLVTILGALLIIAYVGYQMILVVYSPVDVETATSCSEYEVVDTDGLIIRNETPVSAGGDGFIYYVTENGSRVAKNGHIADIYQDAQSASVRQQLLQLNEEISDLEVIQQQGNSGRISLSMVTTQLRRLQNEVIDAMSSPSFAGMETMSTELLSTMNKQQITIGRIQDYSARLAELGAKRSELEARVTANPAPVTSPVAGYFVNRVDGFEQVLTIDTAQEMTPESLRSAMERQETPQPGTVGKVVGSYEWYLACVIPAQKLSQMNIGSDLLVRLPFVSSEPIPVTLVAQNRDEQGEVAVVFRCTYMSAELSDIRKEKVEILITEHNGLRVPDEAVHFNDEGEAGVYVRAGDILAFRRIQVVYHGETDNYSICAQVDDPGYLQIYDDMVVEGKNLYDGKVVSG